VGGLGGLVCDAEDIEVVSGARTRPGIRVLADENEPGECDLLGELTLAAHFSTVRDRDPLNGHELANRNVGHFFGSPVGGPSGRVLLQHRPLVWVAD